MTFRTLRRVCFIVFAQWALVDAPHVGTPSGRVLASELDGSLGVLLVCAMPPAGGKDAPMAKISPALRALYEAYRAAQRTGIPFTSTDPLVPVVGDRVVIDVSASGNVGALQTDLVALGMTGAVSAGRIVSGQLPISALGSLATLPTLQFAWPAAAQTNRGPAGSNDQP